MTREKLVAKATEMGEDAGKAAGSWYFDGNTPTEAYQSFLIGYEKGDPLVLDTLPGAPLSGEWAESMTPSKLLEELGVRETAAGWDAHGDLVQAYEDGFYEASQTYIVNVARYHMIPEDKQMYQLSREEHVAIVQCGGPDAARAAQKLLESREQARLEQARRIAEQRGFPGDAAAVDAAL